MRLRTGVSAIALLGSLALALAAGAAASRPSGRAIEDLLFQTPSGNIACEIAGWDHSSGELLCAVFSTRTTRRDPLTWYLHRAGPAGVGAPADAPRGDNLILPYGRRLALGVFVCDSRRDGLRCSSRVSGHGFMLSREHQTTF